MRATSFWLLSRHVSINLRELEKLHNLSAFLNQAFDFHFQELMKMIGVAVVGEEGAATHGAEIVGARTIVGTVTKEEEEDG